LRTWNSYPKMPEGTSGRYQLRTLAFASFAPSQSLLLTNRNRNTKRTRNRPPLRGLAFQLVKLRQEVSGLLRQQTAKSLQLSHAKCLPSGRGASEASQVQISQIYAQL